MAFVRKDSGSHQVCWREDGRQRSKRFGDRKAAHAFLAQIERRLDLGAHAPEIVSSQLLRDFIANWIAVDGVRWAETTQRQRTYVLQRWCLPYLGTVKLRELGVARCKSWRAEILRRGASPATVNSVSRVLSAALSAAVEDGLIPANPMLSKSLRGLPQAPSERRAVPVDVVEAIRSRLEAPRDRFVVSLLAYCGLRPAEVLGLRWDDINTGTAQIGLAVGENGVADRPALATEHGSLVVARSVQRGKIVGTKTGRVRVIPLIEAVAQDLAAFADARLERLDPVNEAGVPTPGAVVFPNRIGAPLDWHNWGTRVWRPVVRSIGVDYVPYECRHTFASLNLLAGTPILEVSAWLGHSTPTLTLSCYGHVLARAQMSPGDSVEDVVARARHNAARPR